MPKPVVFIDSEEGDYDNVSGQSVDGARSMAEYLLRQGHEKIAFFCDERMDYGSTKEKLQGVREALEAVGKKLEEKDIFVVPEERLLRSEILTSTHRSLDSVPKPVLLLPEKPDFSESVRLHLKKNRTTHFCDKDEVLFQSFQAFLHKKDP